jgi:hypothetical protein
LSPEPEGYEAAGFYRRLGWLLRHHGRLPQKCSR